MSKTPVVSERADMDVSSKDMDVSLERLTWMSAARTCMSVYMDVRKADMHVLADMDVRGVDMHVNGGLAPQGRS